MNEIHYGIETLAARCAANLIEIFARDRFDIDVHDVLVRYRHYPFDLARAVAAADVDGAEIVTHGEAMVVHGFSAR
jgi:hypothetical protein